MKLAFVYAADSGWINGAIDSLHKIVSPATYDCHLCKLTHRLAGERAGWKDFREHHPEIEMSFHHRNELPNRGEQPLELPVILKDDLTGPIAIDREELAHMGSLEELQETILSLKDAPESR